MEQARFAFAFAPGPLLERNLDFHHELGAFNSVAQLHRPYAQGDIRKSVASLQYRTCPGGLGDLALGFHRRMRIQAFQDRIKLRAQHVHRGNFSRWGQRGIGFTAEQRVELSDCHMFGGDPLNPLALERGLFDLGADGVLLGCSTQRVPHPCHFLDLAEEGDAAIQHGNRFVRMPVPHVGCFRVGHQIPRGGGAGQVRRDRLVACRGARQLSLPP